MKVLHYLNQFFAGIGGEDQAGQEVVFMPRAVGVGVEIEKALQAHSVEYKSIACGDNYFHEAEAASLHAIGAAMDEFRPDLFLAGP
ncbi:MAG TPA: glycine/sarcosine/betaine reductase selenoprotein B family protein, partial [Candidatus Binatus sp.]|nr:glycine/sarcosine/betaine reductase selenoprotein B family protein [Candidatus Binatus sp.]